MGESDGNAPEGDAPSPSPWDREPELVSLEFVTWEHAAIVPGSWGKAERTGDLRRLLPHDLTDPFYALLRDVEKRFLRRTEPIPPLRERLARDFDVAEPADILGLEGELRELTKNSPTLGDVVPDWDVRLAAVLGSDVEDVARRIRYMATLGLPRASCSLHYGYGFNLRRIPGRMLGAALATHQALLMGQRGPNGLQPGPLRDFCDLLSL